jgi:fatty-acyl-CoA synthase
MVNLGQNIKICRRNTLGDAFHRTAQRCRDKVALVFNERSWTYRELDAAVSRVAQGLIALGYQKGERVAAYDRNSDAYVILMLGCVRAGLIHVPINFGLSGDELVYVLQQSGAKALAHGSLGRDNVAEIASQLALQHIRAATYRYL